MCLILPAAAMSCCVGSGWPLPAGAWHHSGNVDHELLKALGTTAALGGAAFVYGSVLERNWFALRRIEVPVLPAGTAPLRVLHISDVAPDSRPAPADVLDPVAGRAGPRPGGEHRGLHRPRADAVQPFLDSLGPLLDRPGVFVLRLERPVLPDAQEPGSATCGGTAAEKHLPAHP